MLERDPDPPSPKSASRRFNERISELAERPPSTRALSTRLLDEGEEGLQPDLDMEDMYVIDEDDSEATPPNEDDQIGMGGVVLDPPLPNELLSPESYQNVYLAWQQNRAAARRAASAITSPESPISDNNWFEQMGLFGRLSGELRNHIYYFALVRADGPYPIVMQPGTCSQGPCTHMNLDTAVPGLLSASREISRETIPIFCAGNTSFRFDAATVRARCPANWLRALKNYASYLRQITLAIVCWEPVAPHTNERGFREHELRIYCPTSSHGAGAFAISCDAELSTKAAQQCDKLDEHVKAVNRRFERGEKVEQLLLELVWSDLMADLVYLCGK